MKVCLISHALLGCGVGFTKHKEYCRLGIMQKSFQWPILLLALFTRAYIGSPKHHPHGQQPEWIIPFRGAKVL